MPSFQAALPGKPDQMSPIRAAVPSEAPPVRRLHRAKRRPAAQDSELVSREYDWFVEHLQREGTFLCRTTNIPGDLNAFRLGLREAARVAGLVVETTIVGDRFFAGVKGFRVSEAYMTSLSNAIGESMLKEFGIPRLSSPQGRQARSRSQRR